jgi:hypothetical protein
LKREVALVGAILLSSALAWGDEGVRASATAAPVAAAENERCVSCHADIAAEWSSSLHRSSFRDASFARGYAIERLAFCRGCHAPEADPKAEPDAWSADHGVTCTSCHGATVTAAHDATPQKKAELGERVCAGCHEFGFPERDADLRAPAHAAPARMMQRTAAEHAAGPHAGTSCATCHLPKVGEGTARHASHRFGVTRNRETLANALTARGRREGSSFVLDLAPNGVGHAFPTGDMFRRLRVVVEVGHDGEAPVARFERKLARTFGTVAGKRAEIEDTRLTGPTALTFPLPPAVRGQPVRFRVGYQRLVNVPSGNHLAARTERVEEELLLAAGRVP